LSRARALIVVVLAGLLTPAMAGTPLNYVSGGSGAKASATLPLTWGTLVISLIVIAVISALLIGAIWHRPGLQATPDEALALEPPKSGMNWLWIGVGISTLALLGTVVWTVAVLAQVNAPPSSPALTVEVTAHQWWWEVRYPGGDPAHAFKTANEIHIPTGMPVLFKLSGGDVIHSFWVPALSGKTDLIPGLTNTLWLEADRPGTYRGQCAEYCGLEHAKMAFGVVAEPAAAFEAWRAHQLTDAVAPASGLPASGAAYFTMKCGACHAVRGSDAAGVLGPDLSHFATRQSIGAGLLANTPQNLARWIADPQGLKPGNLMQKPELSDAQAAQIVAYVETLK
jgi:cytochrome c oxidase subunit II